jgi:hypothetical protein
MKYFFIFLIFFASCIDTSKPKSKYIYDFEIEYKNGDRKIHHIELFSRMIPEFNLNTKGNDCLVIYSDDSTKPFACKVKKYFIQREEIIYAR